MTRLLVPDISTVLDQNSVALLKTYGVLHNAYELFAQKTYAEQFRQLATIVERVAPPKDSIYSHASLGKKLAEEMQSLLVPKLDEISACLKNLGGSVSDESIGPKGTSAHDLSQELARLDVENRMLRSLLVETQRRYQQQLLRIPSYSELHDTIVAKQFAELVSKWKAYRSVSPSLAEITMSEPYQRIVGMGPMAVPFLLEELKREVDAWFWALTAITGVDPVPEEDQGRAKRMATAWIQWGRQHGIIA